MLTKKEMVEQNVYVCEVCGFKSIFDTEVRKCEQKHKTATCKHPEMFYSFYGDEYAGEMVSKECAICGKEFKTYLLHDHSELAEQIFNLIDNHVKEGK